MAKTRVSCPSFVGPAIIVNGVTTYTPTAGGYIDVPNSDLPGLPGSWKQISAVGATSERPVNIPPGTHFIDTTLSLMIVLDSGGIWRNPVTWAAV